MVLGYEINCEKNVAAGGRSAGAYDEHLAHIFSVRPDDRRAGSDGSGDGESDCGQLSANNSHHRDDERMDSAR